MAADPSGDPQKHTLTCIYAAAILPQPMSEKTPIELRDPTRFLTVAEVAKTLRVSNMTVYRLVNSGQLDAVRVGRSYRIREGDLQRYLTQRYMDAG